MEKIVKPGAAKRSPMNRSDGKSNESRTPSRFRKVVDECSEKISLNPKDEVAYLERGDAYIHLGEPEEALKNYKRAIEINKRFIRAYYGMATAHAILGENKHALAEIAKAIELEDQL
jgi:tetratricopeptide (TPR) repeat protein